MKKQFAFLFLILFPLAALAMLGDCIKKGEYGCHPSKNKNIRCCPEKGKVGHQNAICQNNKCCQKRFGECTTDNDCCVELYCDHQACQPKV